MDINVGAKLSSFLQFNRAYTEIGFLMQGRSAVYQVDDQVR